MSDIDKVDLLQIAIQPGFDKRCNRNTDIPADNYPTIMQLRRSLADTSLINRRAFVSKFNRRPTPSPSLRCNTGH
ncbi:hypothetical protein E4U57_004195 [Claviceps arundinis]|uniref:Uncharacterized protein n=1 Tax=Claviceps arundinis TaxID=1623583 RepID=A0ABQ7P5G2_9HYPO|nr:hypothetical protein E4U57_004195 [Claviceps arundinis]